MKNNKLIMISGPAASGKTTLIKMLEDYFEAKYFRPVDSYFEISKQRSIPVECAFSVVNRDEAEEYFCNVCKNNPWVIGDQHLAIQFHRDSQMAVDNSINDDIEEDYSQAVSAEFINNLENNNISVLIILLKADPHILFERARNRYFEIGHTMRNKTEGEVEKELKAELSYFEQIVKDTGVGNVVIDTTNKDRTEVFLEALKAIKELWEND